MQNLCISQGQMHTNLSVNESLKYIIQCRKVHHVADLLLRDNTCVPTFLGTFLDVSHDDESLSLPVNDSGGHSVGDRNVFCRFTFSPKSRSASLANISSSVGTCLVCSSNNDLAASISFLRVGFFTLALDASTRILGGLSLRDSRFS